MPTWHATLTYTLAAPPPDAERLSAELHSHDGTAHVEDRSLTVDLFVRSAYVASPQSAARLASYIARRAIFSAGLSVVAEDGLSVVLAPALGGTLAHAEPA